MSQQSPSYAGRHSLAPAPPGACGQRQAGTGLLLMETWLLISFLCAPPGQSLGTGGGERGVALMCRGRRRRQMGCPHEQSMISHVISA